MSNETIRLRRTRVVLLAATMALSVVLPAASAGVTSTLADRCQDAIVARNCEIQQDGHVQICDLAVIGWCILDENEGDDR